MKFFDKNCARPRDAKQAVTLLELLVVLFIIGILATVSVTVYTGHVERARVAACRDTIRQLELAVNRYEVDTGQLPPSSSGLTFSPDDLVYEGNATQGSFGSGYLQLALLHSLSANLYQPVHYRWKGPYIEVDDDQTGDRYGYPVFSSTPRGYVQLLDPWGFPYYYLRATDYQTLGATEYPSGHPFLASETYYNPSSFQIFSTGHNGSTYAVPYRGEETDDVNNWRRYALRSLTGGGSGASRFSRSTAASSTQRSIDQRPRGEVDTADWKQPPAQNIRLTFPMPDLSHLMFSWPEGWVKDQDKVMKPSEMGSEPVWQFKVSETLTFQQLAAQYKQFADAKVFYEGPDPTGVVPNAFILEVKSASTPEIDLQEDAEGKPYHLLFAFKNGKYTCWWAANFTSEDAMEQGRTFITRVVKTKVPVTKSQ